MGLNKKDLTRLIGKLFTVIKPAGVNHIEFNLEPTDGYDMEYYMSVTYVVPNDSEFLRIVNMRNSDFIRNQWNQEIKKTIEDYFDVKIIISNSSIKSEFFYKNQKNIRI